MKAAVAYISLFDNVIIQEIVEVEEKQWKLALHKHSCFSLDPIEDLDWLGDDYENARKESGNGEIDFCITWIE